MQKTKKHSNAAYEAMKAVALALALSSAYVSALLPARPPRAASSLSAAKVPGATQRTKNTYDLSTIERTLATERDACGVGFVAESAAGPSRRVIIAATAACDANEHRGGCSSDCVSGDGAGILTGMPDGFLRRAVREDLGVDLPAAGTFGAGNVFFPRDKAAVAECKRLVEGVVAAHSGLELIGWRPVPVDNSALGPTSLESEPVSEQESEPASARDLVRASAPPTHSVQASAPGRTCPPKSRRSREGPLRRRRTRLRRDPNTTRIRCTCCRLSCSLPGSRTNRRRTTRRTCPSPR